ALDSLPSRNFVAISQAETALTKMLLSGWVISFLVDAGSAESSLYHHSKACVSSSRRTLLPPGVKLFRRQWLEKLRSDLQLPAQSSGHTLALLVLNRNQTHHRLLTASNDDLLAPASPLNQSRKVSLGFAYGEGFHRLILPAFTSETHGIIRL